MILGSPSHGQEIDGESGEVDVDVFRSGPATVSLFSQREWASQIASLKSFDNQEPAEFRFPS